MPLPPRAAARGTPSLRIVVRSALRCVNRSPGNRRRAQQQVWDWVCAKWPRLRPSLDEMEAAHHECKLPGLELAMVSRDDGSDWTLSVAQAERHSDRIWFTRTRVHDAGDADWVGLETACTELDHAPHVIAPPRLLGLWVQRLELEDAGLPVIGEARFVEDDAQFEAFCAHLLAPQRGLPVIVLSNNPHSRFFGVDPRGLAEAARGLAHVTCLSPWLAPELARRFGPAFGAASGAARVFRPGFGIDDAPDHHPLLRELRSAGENRGADPGAFRRQLCRRICAMSVDGTPPPEAIGKAAAGGAVHRSALHETTAH